MSRATQSKAQTEANAKILRALVKHPDNKVCVDCKKNDPRWASWNIGCFLCIRCSGLHRSMGTHISKVKSIDLDIWTPEQMDSMQKWGNRRCNLYWEAHLKSGHVPADHKIESFIRSKYESRRWAKDGPPPSDPAVLDGGAAAPAAPAPASASATPPTARSPAPVAPPKSFDLFDDEPQSAPAPTANAPPKAAPVAPAAAKASGGGGGGIFDLDWHEPAASTSATSPSAASASGARGKNDIMSLFAARPAAAAGPISPSAAGFGDFGSFPAASPPTSAANSSSGLSGLNSSFGGLDLSSTSAAKPAVPPSSNPWSTPSGNTASSGGNSLFDGQDVWGSSNTSASKPPPKNDAFADIWGDFK